MPNRYGVSPAPEPGTMFSITNAIAEEHRIDRLYISRIAASLEALVFLHYRSQKWRNRLEGALAIGVFIWVVEMLR